MLLCQFFSMFYDCRHLCTNKNFNNSKGCISLSLQYKHLTQNYFSWYSKPCYNQFKLSKTSGIILSLTKLLKTLTFLLKHSIFTLMLADYNFKVFILKLLIKFILIFKIVSWITEQRKTTKIKQKYWQEMCEALWSKHSVWVHFVTTSCHLPQMSPWGWIRMSIIETMHSSELGQRWIDWLLFQQGMFILK